MTAIEQSDAALIVEFVQLRSEEAFGELVRRHLDLVYSAALRQVDGDTHTAKDIAQTVFMELARQAGKLANHPSLAGWLYTTTRQVSSHVRRAHRRRARREEEAVVIQELNRERDADQWRLMRPILDEAMHELPDPDRLALLLRYFEGRELRRVGEVLGLSENAARMRVQRALEKLRDVLTRKGIATTTMSLAGLLATNTVTAAPALLLASVATASTVGAVSTTNLGGLVAAKTTLCAMKIPLSYASVILVAAVPLIVQQIQLRNAREELRQARDELALLQTQSGAQETLAANNFALEQVAKLKKDEEEIVSLRSESRRLQSSLEGSRGAGWNKAVAGLRAAESELEAAAAETAAVQLRARTINSMKMLGLGARIFATDNQNRLPTSFEEMKNELDPNLQGTPEAERFEFYPQPRVISETEPQLFMFREKQPRQLPNGMWERTYTLADGSVQTASSDTPDFTAWELKAGGIASRQQPVVGVRGVQ